ncbi:uncharacterized protein LOC121519099 isoform X2 [Cheilinus undulatus]|uniref:uncharacterized protein LOC121519099 isoform X2 n=1 Tax=Cheilinus undulatus TaxID=241271 RepID=UPI001BD1BD1F|nr:uncharacterized protein LOC121519099 isoform X2 [Cheilinus undulatus]
MEIPLSVTLMLLLTVAGEEILSLTVREGHDATLPCGDVITNHQTCDRTSWFISEGLLGTLELVTHGNIRENGTISKKLRVTADCSLVVMEANMWFVGQYTCRQFGSGELDQDTHVDLSVIYFEEEETKDESRFFCYVDTYNDMCWHTVQWWYFGSLNGTETSQTNCSTTVIFTTHPDQNTDFDESLYCVVMDMRSENILWCKLGPEASSGTSGWLRFIIVCVLLAALIITVVTVNIYLRTTGNRTEMDKNAVQNDNNEDDNAVIYENHDGREPSVRFQ